MRIILATLALMTIPAFAHSLSAQSLGITVAVGQDGTAQFTESYSLAFTSPFEFEDFKTNAKKNSSNLSSWRSEYSFFYPHFESTSNQLDLSEITFDEQTRILKLSYSLENKFARLVSDEQRATFFVIDDKQLSDFIESGAIVVPDSTTIKFVLPPAAEIDAKSALANATISQNEISLRGIQTNVFSLYYRVVKPIGIRGGDIFSTLQNYILVAPILLILLVVIYFRKGEIEKKIENYLVEHSEIKAREVEEDFDIDSEA